MVEGGYLCKVRHLDTPSPTPAEQAASRFSVGQEVGSAGTDAELTFLSPLLTRVDYQPTAVFSTNKLT